MPRALRVQYAGAIYHVINRGNNRRRIFHDEKDYETFWKTLEETCKKSGWIIHSFVLMPNHYHLLVETQRPTLVSGMQFLNSTFTLRYHRRYQTCGHLFQGRYKACLVDEGDERSFLTVSDYIHLNYWRARMIQTLEDLVEKPWSSVWWFCQKKQPSFLRWEQVFASLELRKNGAKERKAFLKHLGQIMQEEGGQEEEEFSWRKLRRSWCWGGEDFRERMLKKLKELRGKAPREGVWLEEIRGVAEETLAEELIGQLEALEKQGKVSQWPVKNRYVLGAFLRERSQVPIIWLAKRLEMVSPGALRRGICVVRKNLGKEKKLMERWQNALDNK